MHAVFLSTMDYCAPHARRLALAFRARRVKVVVGGLFPTLEPGYFAGVAEAVVVGEAGPVVAARAADLERNEVDEVVWQGVPHTFIAMQLLGGQALRDRIAAGPLPLDQALELARQVAAGLARGLGQTDRALDWLDAAFEERSFHLIRLAVDPIYDPIRTDPRFVALLERVGLPTVGRTDGSGGAPGVGGTTDAGAGR